MWWVKVIIPWFFITAAWVTFLFVSSHFLDVLISEKINTSSHKLLYKGQTVYVGDLDIKNKIGKH